MRTKAVRLYGEMDLRLEEFELPEMREDELLLRMMSDSICMSTYKLTRQGTRYRIAPQDLADRPIIVGHECCGEIAKVGARWKDRYREGDKFVLQPNVRPGYAAGYCLPFLGGAAQYAIASCEAVENGCVIPFSREGYFLGSLAEPLACVIAGMNTCFHKRKESYVHDLGIRPGGNLALLGGVGSMGLGAIDYALHCEASPKVIAVTGRTREKIARAESIYGPVARRLGKKLYFIDASQTDSTKKLLEAAQGEGYDDIVIYAPSEDAVRQADEIVAAGGCVNFFAGPVQHDFTVPINFYRLHYSHANYTGSSGSYVSDTMQAIRMICEGTLNPAAMVTHVGGLDSVVQTVCNLPQMPGAKKLVYPQISLPMTALSDFAKRGEKDPLFAALAELVEEEGGVWSPRAEAYLLAHAERI